GLARHRAGESRGDRGGARRGPDRARRPRASDRRRGRARSRAGARRGPPDAAIDGRQTVSAPARVRSGGALAGTTPVPGDKSIAHRALLLSALANGVSTIRGFPGGADVRATLGAIRALGAPADWQGDVVRIDGRGLALGDGVDTAIDCGNSGTTMRLATGLVAAIAGRRTLDGDGSLRRRPMERVAVPLRAMGARITTTDGKAPVVVDGTRLRGTHY